MALFGRPSETLIQAYRDKLQVVASEDPLPIRSRHLELLSFKPQRYEFLATTEQVDSASLRASPAACNANFSIICLRRQVDPTVRPNVPCDGDLQLPPL